MGQILYTLARTTPSARRMIQSSQEILLAFSKQHSIPSKLLKSREKGISSMTPHGAESPSLQKSDSGGRNRCRNFQSFNTSTAG